METNRAKYWDGPKNKAIRYYFYLQNGLIVFNEFRYLLMGIMFTYYALKINNLVLIPIMFVICSTILCISGWYNVHHMKTVVEYLGVEFSTHWAKQQYNSIEKQVKLLEEINEKLKDKKDS